MSQSQVLEFPAQPRQRAIRYGRTMDATFLNSVANHPEVRPWLGGQGVLDLSTFLNDANNIGFQTEFGGFVIHKISPGVYEGHSMFLPEGRGGHAVKAMEDVIRYVFTHTDCIEMVTKAPSDNPATLGAGRHLGFVKSFRLDKGWINSKGERIPVDCLSLPISKWIEKDRFLEKSGQWFHDRLEELTEEFGKTIPVHYDEPAHNRAAGAAVEMFHAGNPVKAVMVYNQWAAFAKFPPLKLLSVNPVVIDMDQVIVEVTTDDMEILKCR